MLRTTGTVLAIALLAAGCRQERQVEITPAVAADREGHIESTGVIDVEDLPAGSTEVVHRYPDGTISARGWMVDDEPVGPWVYFHKNGRVAMVGSYLYGRREHGPWTYRYENGRVASRGSWNYGEKQGEWRYYHENGTLAAKGDYSEGERMGVWRAFHANGERMAKGPFDKGERSGPWRHFDRRGDYYRYRNFNQAPTGSD